MRQPYVVEQHNVAVRVDGARQGQSSLLPAAELVTISRLATRARTFFLEKVYNSRQVYALLSDLGLVALREDAEVRPQAAHAEHVLIPLFVPRRPEQNILSSAQ